MHLVATGISGSEFTFRDNQGRFLRVYVSDDGELSRNVFAGETRDGDGELLEVIEVEGRNGQPDEHFFIWPELEGIPSKYEEWARPVDGRDSQLAVPARYVRGVHPVQTVIELDEEIGEALLADTSVGIFIRDLDRGEDADAEASSEDSEGAAEDEAASEESALLEEE